MLCCALEWKLLAPMGRPVLLLVVCPKEVSRGICLTWLSLLSSSSESSSELSKAFLESLLSKLEFPEESESMSSDSLLATDWSSFVFLSFFPDSDKYSLRMSCMGSISLMASLILSSMIFCFFLVFSLFSP